MTLAFKRALLFALGIALIAATAGSASRSHANVGSAAASDQTTDLISHAMNGGVPNGPSTNPVISNDKRFARAIAFESEASDLVPNDTNGLKDVFVVKRSGSIDNLGSRWQIGRTVLVSRTASGQPANGPSSSPAISGGFHSQPGCVGFLSSASNIVSGDTNNAVDAFLGNVNGGVPKRISLPGGKQSSNPTTAVAVSGDCKKVAFVTGGVLYVKSRKGKPKRIRTSGPASDPAFSTGLRNDLVFAAPAGVYLAKNASGRPQLVGPGGRNPVYNDIKRHVVAYEKSSGGHQQIAYHDLDTGNEKIISSLGGTPGDGDSRDPVIGNSGYYVTFETDPGNLGVNANGRPGDNNGNPDSYLYTDTRKITLLESVADKGSPLNGGGQHPSMSFYANYIVFDSPAPMNADQGAHQIFMRYLGPV